VVVILGGRKPCVVESILNLALALEAGFAKSATITVPPAKV